MAFRFNLQRVLEMREENSKICELQFDMLVKKCDELRQVLNNERDFYLSEREQLNKEIRLGQFEPIRMFEMSLDARKKRMIHVLEQLKSLEEDKILAEQDLIRARRDVKVIEKYRDRKSSEFTKKAEQTERKFFDEQATMKRARTLREEKKGS